MRSVWKCVTLPKEQLAREPLLSSCPACWTKEWWVLWPKFEPSGLNQLTRWIYWIYLVLSHPVEIGFLQRLRFWDIWRRELRRIHWGDPRACVRSGESEHFCRGHSLGNLASTQRSASAGSAGRSFLVTGLCPHQAHLVMPLLARSCEACLLIILLSNISLIIRFKNKLFTTCEIVKKHVFRFIWLF